MVYWARLKALITQIQRSIQRESLRPSDDRGRQRLVMNNLLFHLHPPKVPARTIRFTYTFGLGGLAVLLLFILGITGFLLMFAYTPSPEFAYRNMIALRTQIAFGQLVRNIHYWSSNLLLVVVFLHLLRVFYTSAYRPPREFNWQLGLSLLFLTVAASFTGYLLPWDQLAYWAITVVNSIIKYVPLIGETSSRLLLGGTEINENTLRNFFTLHVFVIPMGFLVIVSYHIWRVRKDKFTLPRDVDDAVILDEPSAEPSPKIAQGIAYVTTIPYLIAREAVFALVVMALLLLWSALFNAPLESAANPNQPPNPAKTTWYFMGLQELLLHFHPFVSAVVIPTMVVVALILLPYRREDMYSEGVWFRSRRGRRLAMQSFIVGFPATFLFVLFSEVANLSETLDFLPSIISNGVIPLGILVMAIFGYMRFLRARGATISELRMALFTLLLASFIMLTLIGNLFRGVDMALQLPWGV